MAFTTFKTSDGQWEYGTGEYEKTIASYLGIKAPSKSSTLPGKLVDALFPQTQFFIAPLYDSISAIRIPTFYIWARGRDGVKRIAEWPFAKSLRDAAFAGFRVTINDKFVTDLQRNTLIQQLQQTAGAPSMTNLARLAAVEKQMLIYNEVDNRVRHAASSAAGETAGGVVLVLLVAGAITFYIAFR